MKKLGKLGGKTILYFELVTTLAIVIGLLTANLLHPGMGVNPEGLARTDIGKYVDTAGETQKKRVCGYSGAYCAQQCVRIDQ